jgi:hypothetical protein
MQYQLSLEYKEIANELDVPLKPVGDAWLLAVVQDNLTDFLQAIAA